MTIARPLSDGVSRKPRRLVLEAAANAIGRSPAVLQTTLEGCNISIEPLDISINVSREGHPLSAVLSSLIAFLAAAWRPPTPLARAIVVVLVIKLIGIAGIKVFMFPDSAQPDVDATAMARAIGPHTISPLTSR